MPDSRVPVLHRFTPSGNCYKVRLTAAHLGIPLERREYDILDGATRTPEFVRSVNPNGRVPVLQCGELFLPESNAACFWLAHGSWLIPEDGFGQADMLRWMFWEQYSHEPNIATLRLWRTYIGEEKLTEPQRSQLGAKQAGGEAALDLMERHLGANDWFVGDAFTLADICLFAYTHVADQAGFDLARWPSVSAWLARVANRPLHIPLLC